MGSSDKFRSAAAVSFSTKEELAEFINAFNATRVLLNGELDGSGIYKGEITGSGSDVSRVGAYLFQCCEDEELEVLKFGRRGSRIDPDSTRPKYSRPLIYFTEVEFDTKEIDITKGFIVTRCVLCDYHIRNDFDDLGSSVACPRCDTDNVVVIPHYNRKIEETLVSHETGDSLPYCCFEPFESAEQKIYNSGICVDGRHKGCFCQFEISNDRDFPESYFVSLGNLELEINETYLLPTRRMRVISVSDSEITLRGHGEDPLLPCDRPAQFQSDFGVKIHMDGQGVEYISYYYHARDVRIDFMRYSKQDALLNRNFWAFEPTLEQVKELVNGGADVQATNEHGFSVLGIAADFCNDHDIYKYLIESGADPLFVHRENGSTVLLLIAKSCEDPSIIDLFVNSGADVNAANPKACTVLHHAIGQNKNPEVIFRLLELGANPDSKDKGGLTTADYLGMNPFLSGDPRMQMITSKETTPKSAEDFRQAVIDSVGYCHFDISQLMAIVDARRAIGKSDSEIIDDLIRMQG